MKTLQMLAGFQVHFPASCREAGGRRSGSHRGHTEVTQGSGEDGGAEQVADIWSDEGVNDEDRFWVSGHDGAACWDAC